VQQKRSHPSQYNSLNDWSEHAQSASSLSSADEESQSSDETMKQTDQPCAVRSPRDSTLYSEPPVDEPPPHPVELAEGARKSRDPQEPGLKRTPLDDITKETQKKKKQKTKGKA
jgi:hypothetical protein